MVLFIIIIATEIKLHINLKVHKNNSHQAELIFQIAQQQI